MTHSTHKSSQPSTLTGTEPKLWIAVGSRFTYDGEEISCDCVELVLSSFHYTNKKYEGGCKTYQPAPIHPVIHSGPWEDDNSYSSSVCMITCLHPYLTAMLLWNTENTAQPQQFANMQHDQQQNTNVSTVLHHRVSITVDEGN